MSGLVQPVCLIVSHKLFRMSIRCQKTLCQYVNRQQLRYSGTLQRELLDNPPNESDIRSSLVCSIPGDGNFDTMITNTLPIEHKNITSLYPVNSRDKVEMEGLDEHDTSFSTGDSQIQNVLSEIERNEKTVRAWQLEIYHAKPN